jgi:glyoxylate utilization-related uncharacterized protein
MKLQRHSDIKPYEAPGHFDVATLRVHGADTGSGSKHLTLGLSYFLPGGGAKAAPVVEGMELIYYVVEGEMTVTTNGETVVLKAGDSIFFTAGDVRESINNSKDPVAMLVMISKV